MGEEKTELRWGVEQRLEFVEFRLFWEGHVNRIDVMQQFGVSRNQASLDLNRYIALAPDNMVYDRSARTYVRGPDFNCKFRPPDAAHYLAQLRLIEDDVLEREDCWIPDLPSYASAPMPVRGINPVTLRSVVGAIRRSEAINVKYQSLSSPEPRWRWIAPHAIAFDGFRWHTRAFCLTDETFKDFLLSRIVEIGAQVPSSADPKNDAAWHTEMILEIGPHPDLSPAQRRAIEIDYGMEEGRKQIPVRQALMFYALKRLGLDTHPEARRPQDQQIILLGDVKLS